MNFWQELARGLRGVPPDDDVTRYNVLYRLERKGRLSDAGRQELQRVRHSLHLDV